MSRVSRRLVFTPHPRHGLVAIPEKVAPAVWEFLQGPLLDNPRRVRSELLNPPFRGTWRAKRGEYVVLYHLEDDDTEQQVVVVRQVSHRRTADARPLSR